MSMLVAGLVFVPLLAVALACFIWSLGVAWPLRDRALLARTVIGRPGARVPRLMSLMVALFVLGAGTFALALADPEAGGLALTLCGAVLGALFLARGWAGYTAGWRRIFSEQPFATLDRKTYSPLALAIGAGFFLLVAMRVL